MPSNDTDYIELLNRSILTLFGDALKLVLAKPPLAVFFLRTMNYQRKARDRREKMEKEGVHVPPFMIVSVTDLCNLKCKGCYNQTLRPKKEKEMAPEKLASVLNEARELGFSIVLLAGGEPLVRRELFEITAKFPDIIFPLFTNGLLIDETVLKKLNAQKNVLPILSIEGHDSQTDGRRGEGVYSRLKNIIAKIKKNSIFWGLSLTVTRENFDTVTGEEFVKEFIALGCRLFFYIDYVPVQENTDHLLLTDEQRNKIQPTMTSYQEKYPALFISFPEGEETFGGCLSSGRGFVHVSPSGNLEPCPFAPYSDTSLQEKSLVG
jgi:MoaA/NifB/PqqE/SkfB family radical SAM enzyme